MASRRRALKWTASEVNLNLTTWVMFVVPLCCHHTLSYNMLMMWKKHDAITPYRQHQEETCYFAVKFALLTLLHKIVHCSLFQLYADVQEVLKARGINDATTAKISRLGGGPLSTQEDTALETMATAMAYFKVFRSCGTEVRECFFVY